MPENSLGPTEPFPRRTEVSPAPTTPVVPVVARGGVVGPAQSHQWMKLVWAQTWLLSSRASAG